MSGRTTTPTRTGRPSAGQGTKKQGTKKQATPALFAARARTARRRSRRPALVAVGLVLLLVALGALVWSGPLLVVRSVDVRGHGGALDATETAQVREAAAAPVGHPLVQVDTGAVADRVRGLGFVADVDVSRGWPSTVVVVVTERVAVAAVPAAHGRFDLVDVGGVAFDQSASVPTGIPVVQVDLAASGRRSLTAALDVLAGLPPSLRSSVSKVRASSPDAVRLRIGSVDVVWGSAARTPRKAEIFQALRRTKAKVIDVSSPETPVTR